MTRLTALDAAFLAFEDDRAPAHVGSVGFFEGAPFRDEHGRFRIDDVRARIDGRLHLVPRLRQIPVAGPLGLTHPTLVDVPDFDIAHHVKLLEVGAPGGEAEVFDLAATLHMESLDRSRPLWELWFVDGLADGRVALVEKIHHAIVDGVSGVEIATVLLDVEPDPERVEPPAWWPERPSGSMSRMGSEVADSIRQPLHAAIGAARRLRHPLTAGSDLRRDLRDLGAGFAQMERAPACDLNQPVGHRRALAVVRRSLEDIKTAAHRHGATVNDLVISAVTGGLRTWLRNRGDYVPADRELRALVPVSLHDGDGELGNQVASLFVPLPVGIEDATERLHRVSADLTERKAGGSAHASQILLEMMDLVPAPLGRTLSLTVQHQTLVNLVITNVPGPSFPLFAMGARMLDATPVVPLSKNMALAVGVLSYDGALNIGLYADPEVVPDLEVLRSAIDIEFDRV